MGKKKGKSQTQWPEKAEHVRRLLGLSQKQVADRVGIPKQSYHNSLSEGRNVGVLRAVRIAEALSVPVTWLFDDAYSIESLPEFSMPPSSHGEVMRGLAERILDYSDQLDAAGTLQTPAADALRKRPRTKPRRRPRGRDDKGAETG